MPKISEIEFRDKAEIEVNKEKAPGVMIQISWVGDYVRLEDFELWTKLKDETDLAKQVESQAELLVKAGLEWDILNNDDTPMPATKENLLKRGGILVSKIAEAVFTSGNPKAPS